MMLWCLLSPESQITQIKDLISRIPFPTVHGGEGMDQRNPCQIRVIRGSQSTRTKSIAFKWGEITRPAFDFMNYPSLKVSPAEKEELFLKSVNSLSIF